MNPLARSANCSWPIISDVGINDDANEIFLIDIDGDGVMGRNRLVATIWMCLCFLILMPLQFAKAEDAAARLEEKRRAMNDISVSIVVSGLSCTCARFAEDIRNVVNDLKPDGVRVLPVLGVGGLQNIDDVLLLKSIDMGVVDEDNVRLLKKRDPREPRTAHSIHYQAL
jgi:hypothetical protein